MSGELASEQKIFARVQAGDERAFAELFERYGGQLLIVADAVLRDRDAASDAVQEVFVALWHGRGRHDTPDDVAQYLRRSVRNRALKAVARETTAGRTRAAVAEDGMCESAAYNEAPGLLDAVERDAAIVAALDILQPRTREIFELARTGLASGEIADLLGVSPATVYNQLSRALKLLAGRLAGWDG